MNVFYTMMYWSSSHEKLYVGGCTGVFECPSGATISCGRGFGAWGCTRSACGATACSCEREASLWGRGPSYQACATPPSSSLPYCDGALPARRRAAWLVANMTRAEKVAQLCPNLTLGNGCGDHTEGKPSIGLPQYYWLTEANTALQTRCYYEPRSPDGPGRCPTTFSGPMNLGASFNRSSWYLKGEVLGRELRAFNNLGWGFAGGNVQDRVGISGYGPNINIAR
eukprot:SAG31_NODE_7096_length_1789_cov_4.807692_2_plen_225_part_00